MHGHGLAAFHGCVRPADFRNGGSQRLNRLWDVATPRRAVRHAPCCRVRVIQPTCEKPGRYAKPRQSLVMLRGAAFRIASAKALPPRDENSVCVIITNRLRLVSNTKSQTPRVIPCVDMRTLRRYKGRVPKVVQLATM